jgi:hypothetical protein
VTTTTHRIVLGCAIAITATSGVLAQPQARARSEAPAEVKPASVLDTIRAEGWQALGKRAAIHFHTSSVVQEDSLTFRAWLALPRTRSDGDSIADLPLVRVMCTDELTVDVAYGVEVKGETPKALRFSLSKQAGHQKALCDTLSARVRKGTTWKQDPQGVNLRRALDAIDSTDRASRWRRLPSQHFEWGDSVDMASLSRQDDLVWIKSATSQGQSLIQLRFDCRTRTWTPVSEALNGANKSFQSNPSAVLPDSWEEVLFSYKCEGKEPPFTPRSGWPFDVPSFWKVQPRRPS